MKTKNIFNTYLLLLLITLLALTACTPGEVEEVIPAEPSDTPTPIPATETDVPIPSDTPVPPIPTVEATATLDPEIIQDSIDGRWEGSLTVSGTSLKNVVHFRTEDGVLTATLDIPPQNLYGYDLSEVSFDGVNVHFEGFADVNRKAVWDGALNEDGMITGTFEQLGMVGTFELFPVVMVTSEEPLPYIVEEVTFTNGDLTFGGTLTIPEGEGPFPGFVLITGSGAQNRDEEIYGFKLFAVIADHFTRNGIAVLRYDDRGVGESTGSISESTTEDLAGDVQQAVNYLLSRPEIDPNAIGLLGHSEGGVIAPIVANRMEEVDLLILLAGTALPGEEIIYQQIEAINRAEGISEEDISAGLEQQRAYFDALLRDGDWEAAKAEMRQEISDQVYALPEETREALGDLEAYIDEVYGQQVASMESAWYRFFLAYDPVPALEQITIPVLGLFGGLDLQVLAEANAPVMEAALQRAGNTDATIVIYPDANHLFQKAITGSTTEYGMLEAAFVPGLLEDMTAWILERTE